MRRSLIAAAATAALCFGLTAAIPAAAELIHTAPMSADPVDFTPHILDGTVRAIAVVGQTVVVGGDFSEVSDASGRTVLPRDYLFAYELGTGRILPWVPKVDGPVYALAAGPNGSVYAGGAFRTVNGTPQRGITLLGNTGQKVPGFTAAINHGDVRSLAVRGQWLYAGGTFTRIAGADRVALARLNAASGAIDASFDPRLAAPSKDRVKVEDFALSPDGSRLVAIGAIESAAGQPRVQLAVYNTAVSPPVLSDWYTDSYRKPCLSDFDTYMRGIDFSPDGSYFVIVTTGRASHPDKLCDTAARFELAGAGAHRPTWVNHTGGDSLYAVSVTGSTVYVAGHQRWQNNPYGQESAGPGAVSRKGIAALSPVTGKATDWNPTRTRGVGVRALLATPSGLLVGSDTEMLGREYHGRIGMFPPA